VVQYNEYYPYGLPTASSWTRENKVGNNYLYNGPTETNPTTGWGETHFRTYDPVLARFHQVDPMASKYASLSPYNYAFNNPVSLNDPTGADPALNNPGSWVYYTYHNSRDAGFWYKDRGGWQNSGVNQRHVYGREYGLFNGTRYGEAWAQAVYMAQMHQDSRNLSAADYGAKYGQSVGGFYVNKNYWDGNDLVVMPLEWVKLGQQQAQDSPFGGRLFSFEQASEAFQFMWDNSYETRTRKNGKTYKVAVREVAAWITKEGILVQPWKGPLVDKNGKVITAHAANRIVRGQGAYSYNNFLPFDKDNMTVTFNGSVLSIIGQIHTHPIFGPIHTNQDNSLSGQLGIPIYNIQGSSIYDSSGKSFGPIRNPSKSIFEK
jgi:RHS repeat-associated protein